MKKTLLYTFLVCCILAFPLGCGNADSTPSDTDSSVGDIDTDDDSADTENLDSPDTDTSVSGLYTLVRIPHAVDSVNPQVDSLFYGSYETLELEGDGFSALSEGFQAWKASYEEELDQHFAEITSAAAAKEEAEDPTFYGFSLYQSFTPIRADQRVLSLRNYSLLYTDTVTATTEGINFDVTTGAQLSLSDVVTDYDQFSEAAFAYVSDYLKNDMFTDINFYEDYETRIQSTLDTLSWYFAADGITLIYNSDVLASPEEVGTITVLLPIDSFSAYIKEDYQLSTPGYVSFSAGTVVTYESTQGPASLCITDSRDPDFDDTEYPPAVISLNDEEYSIEAFGSWFRHGYLIYQENGRILLMVDGDQASNDYMTLFFDITDGTLTELDSLYAAISMPGIETVELSMRVDVLGTYTADMTYDITSESGIISLDTEYVLSAPSQAITTIQPLPVLKNKEATTLPVGTSFLPYSTDGDSYVIIRDTSTEEEYEIQFTRDGYQIYIDGQEEYYYFDFVPYAG